MSVESQSQNGRPVTLYRLSHEHLPHVQLPLPLQLPGHGKAEQEQSGPRHCTLHEHWPQLHEPRSVPPHGKPLSGEMGHTAFKSQPQSTPVQLPVQLHTPPQPHVPRPAEEKQSFGQETSAQSQPGPRQPGAHSHTPHVQTPLAQPVALQFLDESHEQSGPVQGGVQVQAPHEHVPWPEHVHPATWHEPAGQGSSEHEQSLMPVVALATQPLSHVH